MAKLFGKMFEKLKGGLTKTRNGLTDKINHVLKRTVAIDDDMYDELENPEDVFLYGTVLPR